MPKPNVVSNRKGSSETQREPEPALGVKLATQETVAKRPRRHFSAADKLRIVKEADSCLASGKRGSLEAMMRREGLYSGQVLTWRTQLGAYGEGGLTAKKPGRKPKYTEAERLNVQLMKRNAELERKLHIANVLIELQKKAHEILGLALPESDGET